MDKIMKEVVERMIAPGKAARLLDVSKTTVNLWLREGKLAGIRTRLGWLVYPDDVERLRKERGNKQSTTKETAENM